MRSQFLQSPRLTSLGRRGGGVAAWTPATLFASGEEGVFFHARADTMFQASGGAAAGIGDPLGYLLDLSGNEHHAEQTNAARKPLVNVDSNGIYYFAGDGVDDFLLTDSYALGGGKMTLAAVFTAPAVINKLVMGQGPAYNSAGSWYVSTEGLVRTFQAGGTGYLYERPTGFALGDLHVMIAVYDRATGDITVNVDGVENVTTTAFASGTIDATFGTAYPLSLCARYAAGAANLPSQAAFYSVLQIDRELTVEERATLSTWLLGAVSPGPFDIDLIGGMSYGQSLAVGQATPVQSATTRFDTLMFYRGMRPQYDYPAEAKAVWYQSLEPAIEILSPNPGWPSLGETPCRGAADAYKELLLSEDGIGAEDNTRQLIMSAPGYGAMTVAQLSYGSAHFSRMIDQIGYGMSLAAQRNRGYRVGFVSWVQGESDYLADTSYADYLSALDTLVDDIQTYLKARSGQGEAIPVIAGQIATHFGGGDNIPDIALAQLACAASNANFYISTPMYHLPYFDTWHLTGVGSRWLGAHIGLAYKRIVEDGEDWVPLQPTADTVTAADWDVTLSVRAGQALEWDTTTVAAQTHYGFTLVDSSDSPLTISSVTITGTNTVRVTAAASIPAGAKLRYAWQGGPRTGLGNLRDDQGDTIVFDPDGSNLRLDNWCVIFELANAAD